MSDNPMTAMERRCVDAARDAKGGESTFIAGTTLTIVRAVLAEAVVAGLPPCAGVVAYDRDECTVTFALDTEKQVVDVVAAHPPRNRVCLVARP
jgi:uncharacterized protein involved in tellurium resistance